jgi:large subunit ribosomal protein L19
MKAKKFTKETILDIGVLERSVPELHVGDAVAVAQRIKEGDKERTQTFEGDIISMKKHGISSTITVRRIGANGVGVERVFPLFSPMIESIKHLRSGEVRRAKLYFMRNRIGKAARVREKVVSKEQASSAQ